MRSAERARCARLARRLLAGLAALGALALAGCGTFRAPPVVATAPAAEPDPVRAKLRTPSRAIQPGPATQSPRPDAPRAQAPVAAAAPVAEAVPVPPVAAVAPAPAVAKVEAPVAPAVQRAYDAAKQALAAGRTAEAERGFAALAKSNPELAGPHANLGLIHRQAGRHAEAVAALEQAVKVNPERADLHNQLGVSYRMAGRFGDARAAYEKAIALDAGYALAYLNLGILQDLYLADSAAALALYERYLQLAAGDDRVRKWISDLKNRSPQKSAVAQKEAQ